MATKICRICEEEKSLELFNYSKRYSSHNSYCKPCQSERDKEYANAEKEAYRVWLSGIGCECCGFENYRALEVHHLSKEYKRFGSSQDKRYNIRDVKDNKAIVLCANCHLTFHSLHGGRNAKFPEYTKDETVKIIKENVEVKTWR